MAAIGEIVRLVVSYDGVAASVAQNVFIYLITEAIIDDEDLLDDMGTWVDTIWGTLWDNMAENSWNIFLSEVDILNNDGTVDRNIGENNHAIVGLDAAGAAPAGVAGYFQAATTRAKSLGKKYIPGFGEGAIHEGVFAAATLANLVLQFQAYTADLQITGDTIYTPGVLSRVTSTFLPFTGSGYATDIPAYQRRRKPGVGS